ERNGEGPGAAGVRGANSDEGVRQLGGGGGRERKCASRCDECTELIGHWSLPFFARACHGRWFVGRSSTIRSERDISDGDGGRRGGRRARRGPQRRGRGRSRRSWYRTPRHPRSG